MGTESLSGENMIILGSNPHSGIVPIQPNTEKTDILIDSSFPDATFRTVMSTVVKYSGNKQPRTKGNLCNLSLSIVDLYEPGPNVMNASASTKNLPDEIYPEHDLMIISHRLVAGVSCLGVRLAFAKYYMTSAAKSS
jgi:hypothetical protein